jgi:hypothetical protein
VTTTPFRHTVPLEGKCLRPKTATTEFPAWAAAALSSFENCATDEEAISHSLMVDDS